MAASPGSAKAHLGRGLPSACKVKHPHQANNSSSLGLKDPKGPKDRKVRHSLVSKGSQVGSLIRDIHHWAAFKARLSQVLRDNHPRLNRDQV